MGRTSRTRLFTGIYEDASGIAIVVSVQGQPREFRRDAHGKPYSRYERHTLPHVRKQIQARERLTDERKTASGHTFAADVDRYLTTLTGRTKEDASSLLTHWKTKFEDRDRHSLTALELRQHAATWSVAEGTYNHRRQALISLYTVLDGKDAPNPARALPKRKEPTHAPRAISYTVINAIFRAMPASKSRARLKVLAYIGLPHAQIKKLTPEDWNGPRLRVTPRRKGAGSAGRWIPLGREAQNAMAEFARLKAWGTFSNSSLYKRWKAYAPAGVSPYALRHSWITELYRRSGGDVLAVKHLALHSQLAQTERYAAAAIEDRAAALLVPRHRATTKRGKSSKTLRNAPKGKGTIPRRKPRQ